MAVDLNTYDKEKLNYRWLEGKVISHTEFEFLCGFRVPLDQIEWVTRQTLKPGQIVLAKVSDVRIMNVHKHEYKCSCGAKHE
jgi:hypothetical protein